jgi:hypothetical protein
MSSEDSSSKKKVPIKKKKEIRVKTKADNKVIVKNSSGLVLRVVSRDLTYDIDIDMSLNGLFSGLNLRDLGIKSKIIIDYEEKIEIPIPDISNVYLCWEEGTNLYKIGRTKRPSKRKDDNKAFRSPNTKHINIAFAPGGSAEEAHLHELFDKYREKEGDGGIEWFSFEEDYIINIIKEFVKLRAQNNSIGRVEDKKELSEGKEEKKEDVTSFTYDPKEEKPFFSYYVSEYAQKNEQWISPEYYSKISKKVPLCAYMAGSESSNNGKICGKLAINVLSEIIPSKWRCGESSCKGKGKRYKCENTMNILSYIATLSLIFGDKYSKIVVGSNEWNLYPPFSIDLDVEPYTGKCLWKIKHESHIERSALISGKKIGDYCDSATDKAKPYCSYHSRSYDRKDQQCLVPYILEAKNKIIKMLEENKNCGYKNISYISDPFKKSVDKERLPSLFSPIYDLTLSRVGIRVDHIYKIGNPYHSSCTVKKEHLFLRMEKPSSETRFHRLINNDNASYCLIVEDTKWTTVWFFDKDENPIRLERKGNNCYKFEIATINVPFITEEGPSVEENGYFIKIIKILICYSDNETEVWDIDKCTQIISFKGVLKEKLL